MKPFYPLIGILKQDTGTSTYSMERTLREVFQPRALLPLNWSHMKDGRLMETLHLLVLPGISSENSPYHDHLGAPEWAAIRQGFDAKMCLFGSCAGMFDPCGLFSYHSPNKHMEERRGAGIFAGKAHGPAAGWHRPDRLRLVSLSFKDASGKKRTTKVAYHNGGGYTPASGEKIDIIARYNEVKGKPIAIAGKEAGKGYAVIAGPLPEITLAHMYEENQRPHIVELRAQMGRYESNRQRLMQAVAHKFKSRWP